MTQPPKSSPHVWAGTRALRATRSSWLYEQVVERLLSLIHELQRSAGDRLALECRLPTGLGLSRASSRQALSVREVQGLVEVRRGAGVILLETRSDFVVLSDARAHTPGDCRRRSR